MRLLLLLAFGAAIGAFACTQSTEGAPGSQVAEDVDPLPSWNEGAAKSSIIDFVNLITDEQSDHFVEPSDRIVTFDNDGTLWAEQPMYFQLLFAIDRVKDLAGQHPEWENEMPYKAILEDDKEALSRITTKELLELVAATHAGVTVDEFNRSVKNWMASTKHPQTGRRYNEMIYQPMLEVLAYLKANNFKCFIVQAVALTS